MIQYLEELIEARDIQAAWDLHQKAMASFGFDKLLYGHTFHRTANSLGDPQDWLVLTNHDPDYIGPFIEDGLLFHAPMVQWALENTGACSWSWIGEQAKAGMLTDSERAVYEFNIEKGISVGYTVSFYDISRRSRAGIALTAAQGISQEDTDEVWKEHGREITVMNNVAHLKISNLPSSGSRRPLTPRQREALEWVGDGKTTQDIATIMGLTPATVEKHLRLAREALDVDTTAQAVLKASFQNQIFVLPA